MNAPPGRDRDTREMIRRFEARRRRRRRARLVLGGAAALTIAGLVTAAIVLATHGGDSGTLADSTVTPLSTGATAVAGTSAPPTSTVISSEDPVVTTGSTGTDGITTVSAVLSTTSTPPGTSPPTTTPPATTTMTTASPGPPAGGSVVVIDPGHQAKPDPTLEPVGPGSGEQKAKVSSGTAGVVTGIPESELVLTIGLKLRDSLAAHGVTVVMTRTAQDVNISNIQRAQIANEAGADLFVRVHADGNADSAVNGIHVLYPASTAGWTDDIAAASKRAATIAQRELIAATGAKDRGINARDDITGFNWSDVPVILPEIGFMTNPTEDKLLATAAYQDKIVQALTRAVLSFLGLS